MSKVHSPKAVDTHLAIEYLRVLCLLSCFTIAGYSDYSRLIVRDKIWILWSLPAIFLLILDFLIIQLSIWNILMVFLSHFSSVTNRISDSHFR